MPESQVFREVGSICTTGKFMLSKFIGKQVETIHNRFCMLEKTNVRQDHERLGSSKEGRQETGQKVGISSAVRYWGIGSSYQRAGKVKSLPVKWAKSTKTPNAEEKRRSKVQIGK